MSTILRRDLLRSCLAFSASTVAARSAWGHAASLLASIKGHMVLIEAESFSETGGWVVDQEFSDHMGSAFLLAHGMGSPVADARTDVSIPTAGKYRVWVRTRDWVAPWSAPGAPGRFNLLINGNKVETVFGTEGDAWHWQDGGAVDLPGGKVVLTLHDLTGFDGRCDAILFSNDLSFRPPDDGPVLAAFRKQALGLGPTPEEAGPFDFVVVGGGMAGSTAAIAAARLGLRVALIQDRPILGGNSSSEIRVSPVGDVNLPPYPALGVVVAELDSARRGFGKPAATYDDAKKLRVVRAEKNIQLFTSTHVYAVEKQGNRISAVLAREVMTSREFRFKAPLFADCTGDGDVGFLAGADFRYGREGKDETGEPSAQPTADRHTSGTTIMWYSEDTGGPIDFPETPWAVQFTEETVQNATSGGVHWEAGCSRDQIGQAELIRDSLFRAIYGNWSFQKNHSDQKAKYTNLRLTGWVGFIAGKRESRRLIGDVVLKEQDITEAHEFPDACVTATWCMDLHVPDPKNLAQFQDDSFRTVAVYIKKPPYAFPYRCLYSRNIENLFMAGRDISVTHVALGSVRVQRTTGMMGEVVGIAASIAHKHTTTPRVVYQQYLEELKQAMKRGVGKAALLPLPKCAVPAGYKLVWQDDFDGNSLDQSKWDFRTDTKHWSTQLPHNISLRDGSLWITVNKIDKSGEDLNTTASTLSKTLYGYVPEGGPGTYTGGGVISKEEFGYGYFEARMRIMAGKGWHSSFWLMKHDGSGGTDSSSAELELDIVENDSIDTLSFSTTTHRWKDQHETRGHKDVACLPLFDYHVFGCEYTPSAVRYFFDGELVQSVDISSLPQGKVNIWLSSIASSLGNTDSVDDSRLPGHVDIDYVRYYQGPNNI